MEPKPKLCENCGSRMIPLFVIRGAFAVARFRCESCGIRIARIVTEREACELSDDIERGKA